METIFASALPTCVTQTAPQQQPMFAVPPCDVCVNIGNIEDAPNGVLLQVYDISELLWRY